MIKKEKRRKKKEVTRKTTGHPSLCVPHNVQGPSNCPKNLFYLQRQRVPVALRARYNKTSKHKIYKASFPFFETFWNTLTHFGTFLYETFFQKSRMVFDKIGKSLKQARPDKFYVLFSFSFVTTQGRAFLTSITARIHQPYPKIPQRISFFSIS